MAGSSPRRTTRSARTFRHGLVRSAPERRPPLPTAGDVTDDNEEDSPVSDPETAQAEAASGQPGVPGWVLAVLGALLVCILAVGGFTLYLVSELEDQSTQAGTTAKTVKDTKAVLDLVAARQVKNEDIPAKVEQAVGETETLLNETQDAIDATNQAIAATNETLAKTNALLDQAEAAATKAQQSAARVQSNLDGLEQGQKQLATTLHQEIAKIQARLKNIENRLAKLGSK